MMSLIKVDFAQIEWRKVKGNGRDGKEKSIASHKKLVRLLEFSPKWSEKTWCERGHVGYVLKGKLFLKLGREKAALSKGQAFVIEHGEKHKAFCKSKTRVLLVDEAPVTESKDIVP